MERCLSRNLLFYFILNDVSSGTYNLATDLQPNHSILTHYPNIHFNIILPTAFQCSLQILCVKYTIEP
jgi:hypothetical protein